MIVNAAAAPAAVLAWMNSRRVTFLFGSIFTSLQTIRMKDKERIGKENQITPSTPALQANSEESVHQDPPATSVGSLPASGEASGRHTGVRDKDSYAPGGR
jgi:hypothetical protein